MRFRVHARSFEFSTVSFIVVNKAINNLQEYFIQRAGARSALQQCLEISKTNHNVS